MITYFTLADWMVFLGLFVMGGAYWLVLDLWLRNWPDSYEENVWLQVVIGVFYVLFGLSFIIGPEAWLRVMMAFIFASILIIVRSVILVGKNRRRAMERMKNDTR